MRKRSLNLLPCLSIVLMLFFFVPVINAFATTTDNEDNDTLSCSTELRAVSSLTKRAIEDDSREFFSTTIIPGEATIRLEPQPGITIHSRDSELLISYAQEKLCIRAPPMKNIL